MLYQIDVLRTAIETAKRILTKEKIDEQRTGHSSASPFIKASQENSKKNCKKGVSFGALETIERKSASIDKLTSLVNKLDMKLDRRKPSIDQEYIRVEIEDTVINRTAIGPGIGLTAEIVVNTTIIEREELITMIEITDPIIELGVGQEIVMEMVIKEMTGMTVDQVIEETISDSTMETKGTEIKV